MKKYIASLSFVIFAGIVFAGQINFSRRVPPAVATVSASTTNTAKGSTVSFGDDLPGIVRLTARASSVTGASGNVILRYEVFDGTNWDTAAQSSIYLTLAITGVSTNQVGDFFNIPGGTKIRLGQIENGCTNVISNIDSQITYSIPLSR